MTILFKDLVKSLVRRLGRTTSTGVNRQGQLINNSETEKPLDQLELAKQLGSAKAIDADVANCYLFPFVVKLRSKVKPSLHLTYLRLQSFRRYPEVASFSTYRTQTYLGPTTTEAPADATCTPQNKIFEQGQTKFVKLCPQNALFSREMGPQDLDDGDKALRTVAYNQDASFVKGTPQVNRVWTVNFQNLQFAQPPSYILITAQKSSECYNHRTPLEAAKLAVGRDYQVGEMGAFGDADKAGAGYVGGKAVTAGEASGDVALASRMPHISNHLATYTKVAGRYVAQNQDSNLSILRLSILVQSSVGSFKFSSDKFPYLRDQAIIWNEHKRNCCTDYFKDATIGDWSKRQCCVLLNVSQYLHGLGSSAGVAFPIQISADVDFANQCRFVSGVYGYDNKYYNGPIVHEDPIIARPVFVGLFDKQVVQVASSSAVLSAQNLSQASAVQILASRQ